MKIRVITSAAVLPSVISSAVPKMVKICVKVVVATLKVPSTNQMKLLPRHSKSHCEAKTSTLPDSDTLES